MLSASAPVSVQYQGTAPANGSFDASIAFVYTVVTLAPCSNATLLANPAYSLPIVNTSIQFTAGASCGGVPIFRWVIAHLVGNDYVYTAIDFSPNPVFVWTPTEIGTYFIYAIAQNQGGPPGGPRRRLQHRPLGRRRTSGREFQCGAANEF